MGIDTGWWLCTAQLYLQVYDVALWLRLLIPDSHSCFLPACLLTAVPGPVPLAGEIHHDGILPLPPWSDPFPSHATQSVMPELPFQNLEGFNAAHKMSSIQLHVKWRKYASTENWPWKSSTRKNFLLKILPLLHPGEAQASSCFPFLMMCELFTLGCWVSARHSTEQHVGKGKEKVWDFSGEFYTKDHHRSGFCLAGL